MATNPIRPVGNASLSIDDVQERARRQDEERRIREDDEHFRQTGENRLTSEPQGPLIEDNRIDVANDGDSYDENSSHLAYLIRNTERGYVEDQPTQIIDPSTNRQDDSNRNLDNDDSDNILARNRLNEAVMANGGRPVTREQREAFIRREIEAKEQENKKLAEENKVKFNNAISGLELDD